MKTYDLIPGMQQHYDRYSDEDRAVWKLLYERQFNRLGDVAVPDFGAGLNKLGFQVNEIPNFANINEQLASLTAWSIRVVPGIISEYNFFSLLARQEFPSTTWLRPLSQLEYLPEPDMFHDAFGHMPLLSNPVFCAFFKQLGKLGLQNLNEPKILQMLGRIYWFTIEFGLIESSEGLRIYGAGILSSSGETSYSLSDKPRHLPFDIIEIMHTHFDNDKIQDTYFVIQSFEDLYDSISQIEQEISRVLAAKKVYY